MNIVIMGCGKVGSELASTLVSDGNNVAVIDREQKHLDEISEELDVLTVCGDGADIEVLRDAGIDNAELFIAVSPNDEVNLMACLIAKQVTEVETIARVRKPMYYRQSGFLQEKLGVSGIINPEKQAAEDIVTLLDYPAFSRADTFADGNVIIFTLHSRGRYGFAGHSLMEIRKESKSRILACAVYRKGKVFIPDGSFHIEKDDEITFITTPKELPMFLEEHNINCTPARDIMIIGGGTMTYYLTESLLAAHKRVRIIEQDPARCEFLSETFPDADVIYGDGTDRRFLVKQGLMNADAFVALTGIDEENIVTANYAKDYAKNKVVTKVNRTDLRDVIESLDIDSAVFPKVVCADVIAQYVRAKKSGAGKNLELFLRYMGNRVEITEFKAQEGDPGLGVTLKDLETKKDLIVACVLRDGEFNIPSGRDMILPGDSVVVVTKRKGVASMKDILA